MAAIASGLANSGLVVADHGPAVGEHEAHGRHGRIATGLSPHGNPGHLIGPDRLCGGKQLFESLGNRQVPGRKRIAIDEQGHRLGSDRHGVAFAALPHRKGSGCFEKVVLVIPAWIGQRPVGIIGVQRFEPSVRDALAISRVHEDVGCLAAAIELDRQRAQVGGLQSEVGNDADTGELGEIPQQRSDRVRPGMDRARERDRLPRKLFPIYRSVGVDRGGFLCETPPRQHGEGRHGQPRRAQSLDEAAPAGRRWTARRMFTW